ncbi:type II secretion system minor pseudopilin GspI [Yersinia sp. Marseille-Q3913]|uniref:type II secretion system minor pseudopilin GspI n=1 Tax=Yersinia sp. Marseille-Q3913 TaxID=2830769 RepID=UPI001BAFE05C|nr:type II secretion system minor pseudopilin GspI [Yersinia sp. Marseille-Q3913]MBS0056384.1 type II secretion system minor pseudopilin GspI [Yersinia sp. Marseille-Q3913]
MFNSKGFTLLELMISLAIFAFCAVGIMKVISEKLILAKKLENRLVSSWVAENVLSEIKIMGIEQTENWLKGQEFMMNKLWYWQSKEIKCQEDTIITIIIEVRDQEDEINPYFILEGYRVINK